MFCINFFAIEQQNTTLNITWAYISNNSTLWFLLQNVGFRGTVVTLLGRDFADLGVSSARLFIVGLSYLIWPQLFALRRYSINKIARQPSQANTAHLREIKVTNIVYSGRIHGPLNSICFLIIAACQHYSYI